MIVAVLLVLFLNEMRLWLPETKHVFVDRQDEGQEQKEQEDDDDFSGDDDDEDDDNKKNVSSYNNIQKVPFRKGKEPCEFFVKTGRCGYGMKCKYDHPIDRMLEIKAIAANSENLPIRPAATNCEFFMKTSYCKFGWTCKFNHPQKVIDKRIAKSNRQQMKANAVAAANNDIMNQQSVYIQEQPEYSTAIPVVALPMFDPNQEPLLYFVDGLGWVGSYPPSPHSPFMMNNALPMMF